MRTLAAALVGLLLPASGCGAAALDPRTSAEVARESEARRTLDLFDEAVAAGDVSRALACFTKDARVVDALSGEHLRAEDVASLWSARYARAADRAPRTASPAPRVSMAPSGKLAWFERVSDAVADGARCASGLLVDEPKRGWRISHCELGGVDRSAPVILDAELHAPADRAPSVRSLVSSPSSRGR